MAHAVPWEVVLWRLGSARNMSRRWVEVAGDVPEFESLLYAGGTGAELPHAPGCHATSADACMLHTMCIEPRLPGARLRLTWASVSSCVCCTTAASRSASAAITSVTCWSMALSCSSMSLVKRRGLACAPWASHGPSLPGAVSSTPRMSLRSTAGSCQSRERLLAGSDQGT